MSLTAGSTVGRYQIHSLFGSGGMGEVYKAHDPMLGRPVALKVLRRELGADPERLARFLQEARAASALNHPNILHHPRGRRSRGVALYRFGVRRRRNGAPARSSAVR